MGAATERCFSRTQLLQEALQALYFTLVIEPIRKDLYWNVSRVSQLAWKKSTPREVQLSIVKKDKQTVTEHGGLSPLESLEFMYLCLLFWISGKFGKQPFGAYAKQYLASNGEGTVQKPYRCAYGAEHDQVVLGLIRLAKKSKNGIVFEPKNAAKDRPLLEITRDFEVRGVRGDCLCEISELLQEMLQHPELMQRSSKNRFSDTIQWYREHAAQYADAISHAVSHDQINAFSALLPPNATVLDVGANGGRDEREFLQRGFSVTGLDLSYESLQIAQQKNPEAGQVNSDMLHSPFSGNSFDGLWVHASLHHLDSLTYFQEALKELERILKKDGIIHIATQAKTTPLRTALVVDELTKEPRQYLYVTKKELLSMLTKLGFSIVESKQFKESEDPNANGTGRKAVEWIVVLARKK